ncbi:MMPL family transporter [Paractinoplanes maris]|uniref:MMPL family transporter n=1 Tax=Paractinoplanes maris TaxID=1734446 RepID=UPI0020206ACD|nr:MMPL family transporter [Actinoplanes maris]
MFAGWGSWVARFRWPVLSVALVAVISAGVWGLGVFGQLTEGGYNDPDSESSQATEAVQKAFGAQGGDLVVIYTPTKGKITDVALGQRIRSTLQGLPKSAVKSSTSYWSTRSPQFVAKDKTSGVALLTLAGADDGAKLDAFREIDDKLAVAGTKVQLSGGVVLADATSTRSTQDLAKAEIISLPITLILLVLLFGSLVAASVPVLVGGAAVLGSLGILHAIAGVHDVNSFAVNVASLLGLGMAIDYGLFMVGRFREEQSKGRTPAEAVRRTVATAGRTVVFSATLLMIALGGLLLFPQGFLKSLAYGGLAAVGLAALLSLTLLPALLAVLGPRIDKLPIKLPGRGNEGSFWGRLAAWVLRHRVLVALPILAGLLVLAAPIAGVRFGEADERTLPAQDPARQAIETLKADYPQFTDSGVPIVLRGSADTSGFAVTLRQIPGIAQIGPAQRAGEVTVFNATLRASDPFSTEAREVVDRIRSLPTPNGAELLVGGATARNVDSLAATAAKLPLMVAMLVGATLLLMFFAFGSILLPIKAVLMSALSLSATFGILVWIFQDGHLAGTLNVTPAPLEAGIVVLMAAVVFGLSTDYEVFLLSRMVEARAHGASTNEAVTIGLARTGRVISAAALLLIVVTGAFALSSVTTMRFVGVGMIVALLLDATVVRMLLVPAVMGLLGNAVWWAPGPLRRLQERAGLSEHAGEEPPALPPGRHAAGEPTVMLALPPGPNYSAWDREAAGVMLLPPGMVGRARPGKNDTATEVIPKVTDEAGEPGGARALPAGTASVSAAASVPASASGSASGSSGDDDIVDAEIIEDDEPVAGETAASESTQAAPDDEQVDAEIVEDEISAASDSDSVSTPASALADSEPVAASSAVTTSVDEPATGSSVDAPATASSSGVSAAASSVGAPETASPGDESASSSSDDLPDMSSPNEQPAVPSRDDRPATATPDDAPAAASADDQPASDTSIDAPATASSADATATAFPVSELASTSSVDEAAAASSADDDEPAAVSSLDAASRPAADETDLREPVAGEDVTASAAVIVDEPVADGGRSVVEQVDGEPQVDDAVADVDRAGDEPVADAEVVPDEPVADDVVDAEVVEDEAVVPPYLPEPYYPMPGLYRSESRSTEPDYSAPDDFFFAPSSAGTFASSLELPAAPESTVPYFGDRPDFESTRNLADLAVTRSFDAPDLDATTTFEVPAAEDPPAIFEAPNRRVARTFETPDPETSGSIVLPDLIPAPAEPVAQEPEPELDVTRSFDAPDLEATRRLQIPGLETTRHLPAPAIERARRLENPAPSPSPDVAPLPKRPTSDSLPRRIPTSEPLPQRIVPPDASAAQRIVPPPAAEPLPQRTVRPTAADPQRSDLPSATDPLPRRAVPPTAADPQRSGLPSATDPLPRRAVPPTTAEPLPHRGVPPTTAEPQRILLPPAAEPPPPRRVPPAAAEPLPRRTVSPASSEPVLPQSLPMAEQAPVADPLPPRTSRPEPSVAETGGRRSDLGSLFAARRAAEPDERPAPAPQTDDWSPSRPAEEPVEPTPLRRPATLGERPYSFRPGTDIAEPAVAEPGPPVTPSPAYASSVTPPAPRRPADLGDHLRETRPADLGDHLRESRPADLAQYSSRTRRPTSEKPRSAVSDQPAKPARRPATLADQLPKPRRSEDDQPDE